MCNNNGKTFLGSILPLGGTTTTYVLDLTHFLCGNRKVCVNASYPISVVLEAKLTSTDDLNGSYGGNVLITGTLTYMPYRPNCCNVCPITESIYINVVVPLSSPTGNTITPGNAVATAVPTRDCCTVTNVVDIVCSLTIAPATGG